MTRPEDLQLVIHPLVGVSPVFFGMTQDDMRTALGSAVAVPDEDGSGFDVDYDFGLTTHLALCPDSVFRLDRIEVLIEEVPIIFHGLDLRRSSAAQLIAALGNDYEDVIELGVMERRIEYESLNLTIYEDLRTEETPRRIYSVGLCHKTWPEGEPDPYVPGSGR